MLRDLNENEMEMVSGGGTVSDCVGSADGTTVTCTYHEGNTEIITYGRIGGGSLPQNDTFGGSFGAGGGGSGSNMVIDAGWTISGPVHCASTACHGADESYVYSIYSITRKFWSEIILKLSVTVSRKFFQFFGMVSRKNLRMAWPNSVSVG